MYNLDFFILLYIILSPFMIMNYEYNNKKRERYDSLTPFS